MTVCKLCKGEILENAKYKSCCDECAAILQACGNIEDAKRHMITVLEYQDYKVTKNE
jgi:hypothetical protein